MAYHEGGHAVAALVQDIGFTYATVLSPDDTAAATVQRQRATYHARDADQDTRLHALVMDAVVCLAGPHGQARHRPPKGRRTPDEWNDDTKNANSFAHQYALVKCREVGWQRLVKVRFGTHYGLKSDIALSPKSAMCVDMQISGDESNTHLRSKPLELRE